jgi:hypothetical protein
MSYATLLSLELAGLVTCRITVSPDNVCKVILKLCIAHVIMFLLIRLGNIPTRIPKTGFTASVVIFIKQIYQEQVTKKFQGISSKTKTVINQGS